MVEFNKQNLLVFLTLFALIAWLGKSIAAGVFEFKKSPLNVPLVVFLVLYALSSYLSLNWFQSAVGLSGLESFSFLTIFCFAILYLVILNNFDSIEKVKGLLIASLGSSFIVGLIGLLQMFGKYILSIEATKSKAFNTIGTFNSFGIFCAFILTIVVAFLLSLYSSHAEKGKENLKQVILTVGLWLVGALMFVNVLLVDFNIVWIGLIVAMMALLAFNFSRAGELNTKWLMLPMIILVFSVLFMFINLPIDLGLPAEVSPSYGTSWQISKASLAEDPLLGSGPGTFAYDYSLYKPAEISKSYFWNVRFDRSISHFLTSIATAGILGTVSWLILVCFFLYLAISRFAKARTDNHWLLGVGLLASWLILLIAKFAYSSNLTLEFITWIYFALIVVFALGETEERRLSFEQSPKVGLLVSFVFIIVLTISASGLYLIGQRYAAEAYYVKGLKAATGGDKFAEVNTYLSKAARLNRYNDVYYRNLAQLYYSQINIEAQKINTAKDDAEKSQIIKNVQALTNGALSAANQAIKISPKNVTNWIILGNLYQKISGYVTDSNTLAIDAFNKAIELEPANQSHYTNLASSYLIEYDARMTASKAQGADKSALEKEAADFADKAYEQLNKALALNVNYAPAHYQMALYHARKNDLAKAITEMENNYKIYLSDQVLNSDDVGALFQLSLLYYQNKETDKAVAALESVVKVVPNYSNARWYLAAMYEEQGKIGESIEQIEKVLELNPYVQLVKDKLEALKTGKSKPAPPLPAPVEAETTTTTNP